MTKLHLVLCIALFSLLSVQAQEKGDVELGIVGGLNISSLSIGGNNDLKSKSRIGAKFGLSTDFYFSDQLSLRARFLYDSKGGEIEWEERAVLNGDAYSVEGYVLDIETTGTVQEKHAYTIKLNYFSLPIMANFHFGFSGPKNFNLNLGPYVAFLVGNAKYDGDYDIEPIDVEVSSFGDPELKNLSDDKRKEFEKKGKKSIRLIYEDYYGEDYDEFNEFDLGLAFGLGYKFSISDNTRLFIEYQGQFGFLNIAAYNSVKNIRHSFNVGLVFNITN